MIRSGIASPIGAYYYCASYLPWGKPSMSSARRTRRHSRFSACLLSALAAGCAHGGSAAHPDEHVEPAAPHLREPEAHAAVAMPDPQVAQDVTLDAILAYADAHAPLLGVAR